MVIKFNLTKMSPAAAKVFPSSIFTSNISHNKQQQYLTTTNKLRSRSDNMTAESSGIEDAEVLTVWKKSLLMNCNGFTVFNAKGDLVYRVDNYVTGNRGEIVLMDAIGKALLTIRRKRLTLGDKWTIYDEDKTMNHPKLCVRRNIHLLLNSKTLAHVTAGNTVSSTPTPSSPFSSPKKNVSLYEIEGSYSQRSVSVYDSSSRHCVAEIRKKEAAGGISLGIDVFSLIVSRPSNIDTASAMGFVILLEQMFGRY